MHEQSMNHASPKKAKLDVVRSHPLCRMCFGWCDQEMGTAIPFITKCGAGGCMDTSVTSHIIVYMVYIYNML